jgi:glycosyltransferase involved in cell wall biosynthesis
VSEVRTSVILPAYQAWDTLPAALDALRPQVDRPDRELVLVESSGDASQQELSARWPWAHVIVPAERLLPGRARNLALREARGELLAFTDADAVAEPDWLDELEGALNDEVDGVAGAVLNGAPHSVIGTADYLLEFSDWLPKRHLALLHGATCNLLLRRTALDATGFPDDVWPGEDTIVTFRLGASGRLTFAPRARVRHTGRTRFRDFVRHQSQLGAAFAVVCETVEFPYRRLARRRYGLLLPAFRIVGVARRIRGNQAAVRSALRVSPLLTIGAIAWSAGLFRAR